MIRLAAFDLDGTLLDPEKHLTDETRDILSEAVRRNILIVPVTGRPFKAIPDEVLAFPGIRYVIASSGAAIWDIRDGRLLKEDLIDHDLTCRILDELRSAGFCIMVFIDGIGYVSPEDLKRSIEMTDNEASRDNLRKNRRTVDDLVSFARSRKGGFEKFTVNFPCDGNGHLIGVEAALDLLSPYKDRLHTVHGGTINLEVNNATAFKRNAMRFVCEKLGIKKEETFAAGDSGNDLDMIGNVGIFAAMANASSEVLEKADYITGTNLESGAARALAHFAF